MNETRAISRESLRNKKILVLGLAMTGMSVVRHLRDLGAFVTVNDIKPLDENKEAQTLIEENVRVIAGSHPVELLEEDFAFMVKNPGIPYSNPMVQAAQAKGLPVYTDIELVGQLTAAETIGITGSNGKTTTASLTYQILEAATDLPGKNYLAGNIGLAALDVALDAQASDRLVLELSSFQLMGTYQFKPKIAAISNLYPTHLDYHGSLEAYLEAKWQITAQQEASDYLILNADQEMLWEKRQETRAQVIPVSLTGQLQEGAWYDREGQRLMWRKEAVLDRDQVFIPGDHNIQNALIAIAIAKLLGVSNAAIKEACQAFHGVAHRMQFVLDYQGRRFYNDSKATNNDAAKTALRSFKAPIVWIAGGLDRGLALDDLKAEAGQVKAMVVMGETADRFADLAKDMGIPYFYAKNIEEATDLAFAQSQAGDVILLSPACASWDQYLNFEMRGDRFVQAAKRLAQSRPNQ